jgi:hypothetical protein
MSGSNRRFDDELVRSLGLVEEADSPAFEHVFDAAERRLVLQRRHYGMFSIAAVLVAAVVVGMNVPRPSVSATAYVEVAELLNSTYWVAPSDVLLPDRQFDIYQDLPVLIESTEPGGGTLL